MIARCLTSLRQQVLPGFMLQILVVDGGSTDKTRDIVAAQIKEDPRIQLEINHKREIPFAWNLGLSHSTAKYVCIFGAHNVYESNYISECIRELQTQSNVAGCSGRVITIAADDTLSSKLAAWAMSHPFGSSGKSFRTQREGKVDSPAFPVFLRKALVEIGGYDERLYRNEDNDMSRRLLAAGFELRCTWKTTCNYRAKKNVSELCRYGFRNGFWNFIGFRTDRATMKIRHFVPLAFVVGLIASAVLAALVPILHLPRWIALPFFFIMGSHLLAGTVSSLLVGLRCRTFRTALLPLVFLAFHISYGTGTLWSIVNHAQSPEVHH